MKILFISLLLLAAMSCQQTADQKTEEFDYLFVGTYTQKEGHVDGKASGIYVLKFYPESGKMEVIDTINGIVNPSFIDFKPTTQSLYAVSEVSDRSIDNAGWVYHFPYQPATRKRGNVTRFSSLGAYPCYIEANPQTISVANYGGGNIAFYPLDSIGKIIDQPAKMQHAGSGPSSRQEAPHAHSIRKNPKDGFYYAADLGTDEVIAYEKSETTFKLKNKWKLPAGSGPRHIDFHPTLPLVYVNNELSGSIISIDLDQSDIKQEISFLANSATDASGADIHLGPSAQFLYVSNRGVHHEIVVFAVANSGELTFVERIKLNGKTPRNFSIHPDGKYLLVAGQDSSTIEVYNINQQSGQLTYQSVMEIPTPVSLVFVNRNAQ